MGEGNTSVVHTMYNRNVFFFFLNRGGNNGSRSDRGGSFSPTAAAAAEYRGRTPRAPRTHAPPSTRRRRRRSLQHVSRPRHLRPCVSRAHVRRRSILRVSRSYFSPRARRPRVIYLLRRVAFVRVRAIFFPRIRRIIFFFIILRRVSLAPHSNRTRTKRARPRPPFRRPPESAVSPVVP